jgi:hypothetical protein
MMKKIKYYLDLPVIFLVNLFVKYVDKSQKIRKNEYFAGKVLAPLMEKRGIGGIGFVYAWFLPKYETTGIPSDLRKHELWHLQQQNGVPYVVFLAKYLYKYAYNRLVKKMNHRDAYLNISYEIEARKHAGQE